MEYDEKLWHEVDEWVNFDKHSNSNKSSASSESEESEDDVYIEDNQTDVGIELYNEMKNYCLARGAFLLDNITMTEFLTKFMV